MSEAPKKPLTFNEAVNYIEERKETAEKEVRAEAKKAQVSTALPSQRKKYLLYAISLMDRVDGDLVRAHPAITNNYTSSQFANLLKVLLRCKVNGYKDEQIAKMCGVKVQMVKSLDEIGQQMVMRTIERLQNSGSIPLVGAN